MCVGSLSQWGLKNVSEVNGHFSIICESDWEISRVFSDTFSFQPQAINPYVTCEAYYFSRLEFFQAILQDIQQCFSYVIRTVDIIISSSRPVALILLLFF